MIYIYIEILIYLVNSDFLIYIDFIDSLFHIDIIIYIPIYSYSSYSNRNIYLSFEMPVESTINISDIFRSSLVSLNL